MNNECPKCNEYASRGNTFCGTCGRCLKCSENAARGETYCRTCGRCLKCIENRARGEAFCGTCGRRLDGTPGTSEPAPTETKLDMPVLSTALQLAAAAVLMVAVFEMITMYVNAADVFSALDGASLRFFIIIPFPVEIFRISGPAVQGYWILLILTITACVVTAVWKFIDSTRKGGGIVEPGSSENTAAFWVCVFFCAMLLLNFMIVLLAEAFGPPVEVPDFGDQIEQAFGMINAAVWEEVITRVLYIGVPMMVLSFVMTKKMDSLKCLLGGFGMSKAAIVFIVVSGIIFGVAHYPGWEDQLWKVVASAIMGVFLGYVFVRFGLYASILLHFITNYLQSFDWMGAAALGGIVILLLLVVGAIALAYIVVRFHRCRGSIGGLPMFRNSYIKEKV